MIFPYVEMEVVKRCGSEEELGCFLIQTKEERNGWEVAEVRPDIPDQAKVANLLAAAPDLLEALEKLLGYVENNLSSDYPTGIDVNDRHFQAAHEAIARARGQS